MKNKTLFISLLLIMVSVMAGFTTKENKQKNRQCLGSRDRDGQTAVGPELAAPANLAEKPPATPKTFRADSPPKKAEKAGDQSISPQLKERLLKAREFRNLLKFDGFVRLRTPDEFAISWLKDAIFIDDHYIVLDDKGEQLLQFDKDGNFVQPISRQGEGPGEFQRPQVLARAYPHHFVLGDSHGLLLFQSDGTLVRQILGYKDINIRLGWNNIIWDKPDRFYLTDPFRWGHSGKQHGLVLLRPDKKFEIKGFGERFLLYEKKFGPGYSHLSYQAFAKIGDRIWVGSPYKATLVIYDLEGNPIEELKNSYHPNGVNHADIEKWDPQKEMHLFFQNIYNQKKANHSLHQLGPVAIRTLFQAKPGYLYDFYDLDGNLLAKSLKSGSSGIKILDTHGKNLVGRVLSFAFADMTEEYLKRSLSKPEMAALFETGLIEGDEEVDDRFLWLAHLADD